MTFSRPEKRRASGRFFIDPGARAARGGHASAGRLRRAAARAAGFSRLELAATLPGEPFYRRCGFTSDERFETILPDGTGIAFVRMSYNLGALPARLILCPTVLMSSVHRQEKVSFLLHPFTQVGLCIIAGTAAEVLLKKGAISTADLPSQMPWLGLTGV